MNQNAGNFDNNADAAFGSYRDVTGANASNNMTSTLFTQTPTLFHPIPPASSSHSPLMQPSLTVFDTSALVDGPPGHAAISICPREWWQERQPERAPLREEEQWPNRFFSSSPPLQSVPDFATRSAPQLHQAPNQTDLLNLQDTLQLPPPMTMQHRHASGVLLPVNQKLYQATCGEDKSIQDQILKEFIRLESHTGTRRELAIPDDPTNAFWRCVIPGCSQKPQRQWDLAAHYLKHMDKIPKPWACPGHCGKRYARNGDLRRHQRTCRIFQSISDERNPIPSADGGPNSLIGSSHQPTANGSMLASSTTSTYNPEHFPAQYPTQMAGTSNGVMNCVYNPYTAQQTGWPETNDVHGYFAPTPPPAPRHAHNSRHARHHSKSSNTSSNSSAYGAPNGNNHDDHDCNENNVQEPVPIEVRKSVYMADLEVLEKNIRGPGDSRYPSEKNLAHHSSSRHSSIRSTALALATLFVVVSSLFGWQLYRTLSA